jgi:chromosome segregation ATPase
MTGEIKFFRKRFIGGFNRQDVVDYIAELAQQRDENLALKQKAEQDTRALEAEILSLRRECEEAKRQAEGYKSEVLKAAQKTLVDFEDSFEKLCAGFEEEAAGICAQLETARNIIAIVPGALKEAGTKFSSLTALLNEGNDTPGSIIK